MGQKMCKSPEACNLLFFIRADGNDEEVEAWAAKNLPPLLQTPELNGSKTYKLISVTGGHFHGILYNAGFHHRIGPNKKVFKSQTSDFFKDLVVEHFHGQRIWPLENGQ